MQLSPSEGKLETSRGEVPLESGRNTNTAGLSPARVSQGLILAEAISVSNCSRATRLPTEQTKFVSQPLNSCLASGLSFNILGDTSFMLVDPNGTNKREFLSS